MSSNKRIFYACQAVAITNCGDNELVTGDMVHGVQSGREHHFQLGTGF